jgi:M6 family metalloprotease-like protein
MTRSRLVLAFVLTVSLIAAPSFAAVKAGAKCTKAGATATTGGKKFTCIKSGKKLVWNKGVKVSVPKPVATPTPSASAVPTVSATPTPTPTVKKEMVYLPPSEPSANINSCKIKEVSFPRRQLSWQQLPSGFPIVAPLTPRSGTVKWALIPIDFKDLPGEANPISRVEDQMKLLTEWYYIVSGGKFKVEWVVSDKWITLPGLSTEYKISSSDSTDRSTEIASFWKRALTQTDIYFDYTNVQTVNFILPRGQTMVKESLQGFPWEKAVKETVSKEGALSSFTVAGVFFDQPNREYWSYWAHEFTHVIGIPHIGSSRDPNPFNGLDLASGQDGPSRELTGWLRYVAGWIPDEKVYCQEFSTLGSPEITLVPLNDNEEGIKLAVIALSESRALILESRRVTKFACTTPTPGNGVLAYIYDAKLGHGENFVVPITTAGRSVERPLNCNVPPDIDWLLRAGDKITVEGVSVEVLLNGKYDRVKVSRSN